jgi:putative drug exporter of the RND superfamily
MCPVCPCSAQELQELGGSQPRGRPADARQRPRAAALILFFALASLSTANSIIVREIAAGLAAGVILDAIVVRMLLLPALVSLLGKWNWWMPEGARRLLRIKPDKPGNPPTEPRKTQVPLPVGND